MRLPNPFGILSGLIILISLIHIPVYPVYGFYEKELGKGYIELRGTFRGSFAYYKNARDIVFPIDRDRSGFSGLGRLIAKGESAHNLGFEVHAYQTFIPSQLLGTSSGQTASSDIERSGLLDHSFSNRDHVHLGLDRLNVRWSYKRLDLITGRQPVNLATTFYFSPNDFFAPFAAPTFFRLYKPGVDAVRAEFRLGSLSQLSFINVLGYEQDLSSSNKWSNSPDMDRLSSLARISAVWHDFEYAFLGGKVREMNVLGCSFQGEIFKWLGIRSEAHHAFPDLSQYGSWSEICFGMEHRFENSLDMRLEYFYHGGGSDSIDIYGTSPAVVMGESLYLGKKYAALGAGYEVNPLLNVQLSAITNLVDRSYLISLNAVYSLTDESELSMSLGIPQGDGPEAMALKSEFGSYPKSLNIELRYYF